MRTKILKPNIKNIKKASQEVHNGGLIGMPTETVYGLAANGFDEKAVEKIFIAKQRPQDNPLIVHVHKNYDLLKLVTEVNENAKKLLKAFTPGPLTLVLKSNGNISKLVSRGLNTIAIRIPKHDVAEAFLKECDLPIAAPSANISTRMSATTAKAVKEELNKKVRYILDGGISDVGIESTVVDVTGDTPTILRPGKITSDQIKRICGNVKEIKKVKDNELVASPGMKYKHYSPSCPVELVNNVERQYTQAKNKKLKPVVLGLKKDLINLSEINTICLGDTVEDYAKNLYNILRQAEKKYNYILIYKVRKAGLGKAVMNRVEKMVNK